jgi:predicted O-methyltransferase YrrM
MSRGDTNRTPLLTLPLLDRMESVEGWLSRAEGDLLLGSAVQSLVDGPAPHVVVEVGSYCGRSTVLLGTAALALDPAARVYAVDPHEGTVGAAGRDLQSLGATFARFVETMADAGLDEVVVPVRRLSHQVAWDRPICMLFLDGLHDFASVAADYTHFAPHLAPGALVAFHDYADYYPGVRSFVDVLLAGRTCERVARAESLVVLRVLRRLDAPSLHDVVTLAAGVDGWLEPDEASFLAVLAALAARAGERPALVEIGSHCGRGTVVLGSVARRTGARVVAVDSFDGVVGAAEVGLYQGEPTFARFRQNLASAGLTDLVEVVHGRVPEVSWPGPVGLLLVDGLHDRDSVLADFAHFADQIVAWGYAAFHDHADYYPGVRNAVEEILGGAGWYRFGQVGSLAVLAREGAS